PPHDPFRSENSRPATTSILSAAGRCYKGALPSTAKKPVPTMSKAAPPATLPAAAPGSNGEAHAGASVWTLTVGSLGVVYRGIGRRAALVSLIGIVGASMFLGDSVITPAISVLSAVEGLKIAVPAFEHLVLPLSIAILIGLFAVQRRGTARVAAFFGPVMVV